MSHAIHLPTRPVVSPSGPSNCEPSWPRHVAGGNPLMNWSMLRSLILDEEAATASEYAVMLALIIGALITAISSVGGSTSSGWSKNVTTITNAVNSAGS